MSAALARLRDALQPADPARSILPFIPRPLKWLFLVVFLVNCRSWPFNWHIRVFRPVLYLRLRWWALLGRSRATKQKWLESLSPIGKNPFELTTSFKTWASPDDSDYNMHLSNSSYAKSLDAARLKAALDTFATFFRDGGRLALGATHYSFMREIPIFASYEIRMNIASWDNKWLYLVARYVSAPKNGTARAEATQKQQLTDALRPPPSTSSMPLPSLRTPASDASAPGTPGTATPRAPAEAEADGATLHCVAVSQLCFKLGRITVPPALALAGAGAGLAPPQWAAVQKLRAGPAPPMRALLRGGWRDVPAEERWWDAALAPFEERRARGLAVVGRLREGLEGVRAL